DRMREIDRRDHAQVLAAAERAEHELDGLAPVVKLFRQRLRARNIVSARRLADRPGGTHYRGEKILHLALARVTPADANLLPGRCRIDVEATLPRKLGNRIDVGRMDPVRTAVPGNSERTR